MIENLAGAEARKYVCGAARRTRPTLLRPCTSYVDYPSSFSAAQLNFCLYRIYYLREGSTFGADLVCKHKTCLLFPKDNPSRSKGYHAAGDRCGRRLLSNASGVGPFVRALIATLSIARCSEATGTAVRTDFSLPSCYLRIYIDPFLAGPTLFCVRYCCASPKSRRLRRTA